MSKLNTSKPRSKKSAKAAPPEIRPDLDRVKVARAAERIQAAMIAAERINQEHVDQHFNLFPLQRARKCSREALALLTGATDKPDVMAQDRWPGVYHPYAAKIARRMKERMQAARSLLGVIVDEEERPHPCEMDDDEIEDWLSNHVDPAAQVIQDALDDAKGLFEELDELCGGIAYADASQIIKRLMGDEGTAIIELAEYLSVYKLEFAAKCLRLVKAFSRLHQIDGGQDRIIAMVEAEADSAERASVAVKAVTA